MSVSVGGIILCGGRSTRMGRSKAWLPFGPERMLQRVARILSGVVSPIIVVAAEDQELPDLPADVRVARDERPDLGPLAGLAAGLRTLQGQVDAVYASSCDVPLLSPEFVRAIVASLGDFDIAIPRDGRRYHPLSAVYRMRVEPVVRALIAERQLRLQSLIHRVRTREIDLNDLRRVDPELLSLYNANTPDEYSAALLKAGLSPDS